MGGLVSFFPPRAHTFFSGDSGSPVLSRGFLPHSSLPQGHALAVGLSSQDLKGGESGSLRRLSPAQAGPRQRRPLPRGPGAGRPLGAPGPLPKPVHSPCPISLPRAPELAATSAGLPPRSGDETQWHRSERGSQPERETGRGWTRTELEFPSPRASGLTRGPAGEAPRRRVPIPTARVSLRKARRSPVGQVGKKGGYLPCEDRRGGSRCQRGNGNAGRNLQNGVCSLPSLWSDLSLQGICLFCFST